MIRLEAFLKHNSLNDITVVIPTFNRAEILRRSLKYWDSLGVHVLVLDGSDARIFDDGALEPGSKVQYWNFPRLTTESATMGSYRRRMQFAASHIRTRYVTLCGDDDYVLESGMRRAINFLNNNESFDSVFRPIADYNVVDGVVYWNLEYVRWEKNIASTAMDYQTRVMKADRGYINYYAITRTRPWKNQIEVCFKYEFSHPHVNQMLMDEVGKILLRTEIFDDLIYIRQFNDPLKYRNGIESLARWLKNIENSTEVSLIREQFLRAQALAGEKLKQINLVDGIFDHYSSSSQDLTLKAAEILVAGFRWLPERIRIIANRWLPRNVTFRLGYRGKIMPEQSMELNAFKDFLIRNKVPFVPEELDNLTSLVLT